MSRPLPVGTMVLPNNKGVIRLFYAMRGMIQCGDFPGLHLVYRPLQSSDCLCARSSVETRCKAQAHSAPTKKAQSISGLNNGLPALEDTKIKEIEVLLREKGFFQLKEFWTVVRGAYSKDPCSNVAHAWALKYLSGNLFAP